MRMLSATQKNHKVHLMANETKIYSIPIKNADGKTDEQHAVARIKNKIGFL